MLHGVEFNRIPMHCLLLAEVAEKEALKFSDPKNFLLSDIQHVPVITSIPSLFDAVVERRFQNYQSRNSVNLTEYEILNLKQMHFHEAMRLMYPNKLNLTSNIQNITTNRLALLKIGMLDMVHQNSDNLNFVHRLFSEYFVVWGTINMLETSSSMDTKAEALKFILVYLLNTTYVYDEFFPGGVYDFNDIFTPCFLEKYFSSANISALLEASICPNLTNFPIRGIWGAAAFKNKLNIAKFLKFMNCTWYNTYVDTDYSALLKVAIGKASVTFLEIVVSLLPSNKIQGVLDGHRFGNERFSLESYMDIAARRGDYTVFDFLYRKLDQKSHILSSYDRSTRSDLVLHNCLYDSDKSDEKTVRDKRDIIRVLLNTHPNLLKIETSEVPFPQLIENIHPDLLLELISHTDIFNYSLVDSTGNTFLHTAATYMSPSHFDTLIQGIPTHMLQIALRAKNQNLELPIHIVLSFRQIHDGVMQSALDRMIENGPDINAVDIFNRTPLMITFLSYRHPNVITTLISKGAQISANYNNKSESVIAHYHSAWQIGYERCMHLVSLVTEISVVDIIGQTASFFVIASFHTWGNTNTNKHTCLASFEKCYQYESNRSAPYMSLNFRGTIHLVLRNNSNWAWMETKIFKYFMSQHGYAYAFTSDNHTAYITMRNATFSDQTLHELSFWFRYFMHAKTSKFKNLENLLNSHENNNISLKECVQIFYNVIKEVEQEFEKDCKESTVINVVFGIIIVILVTFKIIKRLERMMIHFAPENGIS